MESVKVVGVGDIMPGGILAGINTGYVSQDVVNLFQEADIRVGTLETAIGNEPNFNEEKMKRKGDVIYARDDDLCKLKHLKFDIISLANNHFFDLGIDGARHTMKMLDDLGISHIGAGNNIYEAGTPVIKTIYNKRIAFLAFCDWQFTGWCPFATETEPGVNPMYDEYVTKEIKKYKKDNDFVVVLSHWGREHTWVTTQRVYKMARKMIKSGADLILGSHPHRVQPVVNYGNASIAFSMGNFLFPDRLIVNPRSTFYPKGSIDLSTLPITHGYPFVDCLTYKKWKPLARVGMIVQSEIDYNGVSSSYVLTKEREDGFVSLDGEHGVESILQKRGRLLGSYAYPIIVNAEKICTAILHKFGLRRHLE